jgi:hypothetical protein
VSWDQASRLLAALPAAEGQHWCERPEPKAMLRDEVLREPGMPMQLVYVPTTAVVSLMLLSCMQP